LAAVLLAGAVLLAVLLAAAMLLAGESSRAMLASAISLVMGADRRIYLRISATPLL